MGTRKEANSASQSWVDIRSVSENDIIIAVMGATGAGKSSFVSLAIGEDYDSIGHGLESHTRNVLGVRCRHPNDPNRSIVFLDTPGFDDTYRSDTDILMAISDWLNTTYAQGIMLAGLLFLHRISDNRIPGSARRNTRMFELLCGTIGLPNVILVTTMWEDVKEDIGSRREDELRNEFWHSMISRGSRMERFHHSRESAWEILDHFTGIRLPVQLQIEMVVEGKTLVQTSAGSSLSKWFGILLEEFRVMFDRFQAQLSGIPRGSKMARDVNSERSIAEREYQLTVAQKRRLDNPRRTRFSFRKSTTLSRSSTTSSYATAVSPSAAGFPPSPVRAKSLSIVPSTSTTLLPTSPSSASFPPPNPGTVSRVDYSGIERHGSKMATAATVLMFAKDIAAIAPVPYLGAILSLAVDVVNSIDALNRTESSVLTLAGNARRFNEAIIDRAHLGPIPRDMDTSLRNLYQELQRVKTVLDEMKTRGVFHRLLLQRTDEAVFLSCNESFQTAYNLFMLKSAVGMRQCLDRIEQHIHNHGHHCHHHTYGSSGRCAGDTTAGADS